MAARCCPISPEGNTVKRVGGIKVNFEQMDKWTSGWRPLIARHISWSQFQVPSTSIAQGQCTVRCASNTRGTYGTTAL